MPSDEEMQGQPGVNLRSTWGESAPPPHLGPLLHSGGVEPLVQLQKVVHQLLVVVTNPLTPPLTQETRV